MANQQAEQTTVVINEGAFGEEKHGGNGSGRGVPDALRGLTIRDEPPQVTDEEVQLMDGETWRELWRPQYRLYAQEGGPQAGLDLMLKRVAELRTVLEAKGLFNEDEYWETVQFIEWTYAVYMGKKEIVVNGEIINVEPTPQPSAFIVPYRIARNGAKYQEMMGGKKVTRDDSHEVEFYMPICRYFSKAVKQIMSAGLPPFELSRYNTGGSIIVAPMFEDMAYDYMQNPVQGMIIAIQIMNDAVRFARDVYRAEIFGYGAVLPKFQWRVFVPKLASNEPGKEIVIDQAAEEAFAAEFEQAIQAGRSPRLSPELKDRAVDFTIGHGGTVYLMCETLRAVCQRELGIDLQQELNLEEELELLRGCGILDILTPLELLAYIKQIAPQKDLRAIEDIEALVIEGDNLGLDEITDLCKAIDISGKIEETEREYVNVGFIGTGFIGAPAIETILQRFPNVRLVIYDKKTDVAEELAARLCRKYNRPTEGNGATVVDRVTVAQNADDVANQTKVVLTATTDPVILEEDHSDTDFVDDSVPYAVGLNQLIKNVLWVVCDLPEIKDEQGQPTGERVRRVDYRPGEPWNYADQGFIFPWQEWGCGAELLAVLWAKQHGLDYKQFLVQGRVTPEKARLVGALMRAAGFQRTQVPVAFGQKVYADN